MTRLMRMFLIIVVCAWSLTWMTAHAQSIPLFDANGNLTDLCGPTPRVPPLGVPLVYAPSGLPKELGGIGTPAVIEVNKTGAAAAWWTPTASAPLLSLYAVRWDAVTPAMVADYLSLPMSTEKSIAVGTMQSKYQTLDIRDMCDIWHPMVARVNAIKPGVYVPPVTTYVVSGSVSYPAIQGANGTWTRSITPSATKPTLGATCDCSKATGIEIITSIGARYCKIAPSLVAGCSVKKSS